MKKPAFISLLMVVIGTCFTVSAFADFYVIPVRNQCDPCPGPCPCEDTRSAGGRWCDNGDGTVTDMTTCLVWLKYADWGGEKQWRINSVCSQPDNTCHDDAHARAGSLKDGFLIASYYIGPRPIFVYLSDNSVEGDWRLPTKTELVGITTGNEFISGSHARLFEGVKNEKYWSSTTNASNTYHAWCVDIRPLHGNVGVGDKSLYFYVWPVRSGN